MDSTGLSEYAKHCLREICSQEWVREKFLKEPEHLFTVDLLLDKMLSNRQVSKADFTSVILCSCFVIIKSFCSLVNCSDIEYILLSAYPVYRLVYHSCSMAVLCMFI